MPESTDSFATMLENEILPHVRKCGGVMTARDVRRRIWKFRKTDGRCVLLSLVNHGFGRWMNKPAGPKGGRPSIVFVLNGVDLPGATPAEPPTNNELSEPQQAENSTGISPSSANNPIGTNTL